MLFEAPYALVRALRLDKPGLKGPLFVNALGTRLKKLAEGRSREQQQPQGLLSEAQLLLRLRHE